MNNFLIVILGPTGVGKSAVAIEAARHFNSEIISADSRQFYREMKIGTAVPSQEQLSEVPHHFIQFLPVDTYYSASIFEKDVLNIIPSMFSRNRLVFMAGGSAMYIDAVCGMMDEIPDTDPESRIKYNNLYLQEGVEGLRLALRKLDPDQYNRVDLKNPKRIMRALEICESTGKPYSSYLNKARQNRDFKIIKAGLTLPREELYDKINRRVDVMISEGLEEEVRSLSSKRHFNALNSVGYREFFDFFDGTISRDKAIELIKRNSRRYAKRQLTWWNRDKEIRWFSPNDIDGIIKFISDVSGS